MLYEKNVSIESHETEWTTCEIISSGAEAGTFWENYDNAMAADAPGPYIVRSSNLHPWYWSWRNNTGLILDCAQPMRDSVTL